MSDICLINIFGINTLCITNYIVYGIVLFILGMLISIYIPFKFSKKLGLTMIIIGLIMMIGFPLIVSWWANIYFQIFVFGVLTFTVAYGILFSNKEE